MLNEWLTKNCDLSSPCKTRTQSTLLYKNYLVFIEEKEFPMSLKKFGCEMTKIFQKRIINGRTFYYGIALRSDIKHIL